MAPLTLYGPIDQSEVIEILIASNILDIKLVTNNTAKANATHDVELLIAPTTEKSSIILMTPFGAISGVETILRYLARLRPESALFGDSSEEKTRVDMWHETLMKNALDSSLLKVINAKLLHSTYLTCEHITAADILLALKIQNEILGGTASLTSSSLVDYTCISRWYKTVSALKGFPKAAATKAPAKKVETETPPPKTTPPKEKSQLISLPQGNLAMDPWKYKYCNTKDTQEVMKYFFEKFDSNFWTLWYMKYDKLEDECKVGFLSSNQLGGFLQRMDQSLRKFSFGVINVMGNEGDYQIEGVWVILGQEMPDEMKSHPSFEYHTFTRLDANKESDRKKVVDFWCENDQIDGRPIYDCKVWK